MSKRFLQWVGLLAMLALAGLGVTTLALVKERVRVVIADDSDQAQPGKESAALLRDDIDSLHRDVVALAAHLGKVAQALTDDSAQRQAEMRSDLARWNSESEAQRHTLARHLNSELGGIRQELERIAKAKIPQRTDVEMGASTHRAQPSPPPPTQVKTPALHSHSKPPTQSRREQKRRTFLSFTLPSQGFAFAATQRFEILPNLSRVGFDGKSTLHDFTGYSSAVKGHFTANLAHPEKGCTGEILAEARALQTGSDGRDAEMYKRLQSEEHPEIRFSLDHFRTKSVDAKSMKLEGTIDGHMSIRGKTKSFSMPVRLLVDESQRLVIKGQAPVLLSDYGISAPSTLGFISMRDRVMVWVALRARAVERVKAVTPDRRKGHE